MRRFHNFFHWADLVSIFQKVLSESVFSFAIFKVPKMLSQTYLERSASLPNIFHITCRASYLIDSGVTIFTFRVMLPFLLEVYLWYCLWSM